MEEYMGLEYIPWKICSVSVSGVISSDVKVKVARLCLLDDHLDVHSGTSMAAVGTLMVDAQ